MPHDDDVVVPFTSHVPFGFDVARQHVESFDLAKMTLRPRRRLNGGAREVGMSRFEEVQDAAKPCSDTQGRGWCVGKVWSKPVHNQAIDGADGSIALLHPVFLFVGLRIVGRISSSVHARREVDEAVVRAEDRVGGIVVLSAGRKTGHV